MRFSALNYYTMLEGPLLGGVPAYGQDQVSAPSAENEGPDRGNVRAPKESNKDVKFHFSPSDLQSG